MRLCRVDGCEAEGDHRFGLALAPPNVGEQPAAAEGSICAEHAATLWALLGPPPIRATQLMAEELCKEMNEGADAVVIHMDKRLVGL